MKPILTYDNWNKLLESESSDLVTYERVKRWIQQSSSSFDYFYDISIDWKQSIVYEPNKIRLNGKKMDKGLNNLTGDEVYITLVFEESDNEILNTWNELMDEDSENVLTNLIFEWTSTYYGKRFIWNDHLIENETELLYMAKQEDVSADELGHISKTANELNEKYNSSLFETKMRNYFLPRDMQRFKSMMKNDIRPKLVLNVDQNNIHLLGQSNEIWIGLKITDRKSF